MNRIKFLFFIFSLLFWSQTNAQVYRYKATSFSILEKDAKGKWLNWSEFEPSTVIITLDGKKDRVVVASQEIQLYNIMNYGDKEIINGVETIALNCIDNERGDATILFVTKPKEDNRMQIYINYNDVKIVYNVYKVE